MIQQNRASTTGGNFGEPHTPMATATFDLPPAYVSTFPTSSHEISSPDKGNDKAEDLRDAQQRQPSLPGNFASSAGTVTTTFSKYSGRPGWGTVAFRMTPDPYSQEYRRASWAAYLYVWCDDVARLMREGFFWSADNVIPEEGYMFSVVNSKWLARGFRHGRVWILTDKSNSENPRWVGYLELAGASLETLANFRLQCLSTSSISVAVARNGRRQPVYWYERRSPSLCYNCIYDDMPLQGWWPWPKEGGDRATVGLFRGAATWEDELRDSLASHCDLSEPQGAASANRSHHDSGCVVM